MTLREVVQEVERNATLPDGEADRFGGYAVMGVPFRSGHVLALRRFPASSIGPGYTSVWHRDPRGAWTFYSTVPPDLGCARYFGGQISRNVVVPIEIQWTGAAEFQIQAGTELRWKVRLRESPESKLLTWVAGLMPAAWWRKEAVLRLMGPVAGFLLRAGRINLLGKTPNGHRFAASPRRLWVVDGSSAFWKGQDLGEPAELIPQVQLEDVMIPQRGIFALASVCLKER